MTTQELEDYYPSDRLYTYCPEPEFATYLTFEEVMEQLGDNYIRKN